MAAHAHRRTSRSRPFAEPAQSAESDPTTATAPPSPPPAGLALFRAIRDFLDLLLALLKWPLAFVALMTLPGAIWAFGDLVLRAGDAWRHLTPFLLGAAAYFLLWKFVLRRPTWGSLLSTFEHELTHGLFAWLTFHAVVGLKASWRPGGQMQFKGRGNWLISLAPYFFPTASLAVAVALLWVPAEHLPWANGLLGATVAYHITSTKMELHAGQTDLKVAGWLFSALFLPAANVITYSLLLAFALGGRVAMAGSAAGVWARTRDLIALLT